MNPIAYVRDNIAGAWQVMLGRPEGLSRLDVTIEGFWRSFGAFALVLPLLLLANVGFDAMLPEEDAPVDGWDWVGIFIQGVDWVAFPIVFALISPRIGLAARYLPFIAARNWGAVILAALYMAGSLPGLLAPLPMTAGAIINLALLGIQLRFAYLLARTTLAVGPSVAIPVVVLDFLLILVIGFGLITALEGA
jgi:hypothetical protein